MELSKVFRAEPKPIEHSMGAPGKGYYIPSYQRPYAWTRDNVKPLITNMCEGLVSLKEMEDAITFIGTFIFIHDTEYKTVEPRVRNELPNAVNLVIDGQQRISTIMMLSIVLHEQIETLFTGNISKRFKPDSVIHEWVSKQRRELCGRLEDMFLLDNRYGAEPYRWYPRIIRAHTDQWGARKDTAKYRSPVASLISQYMINIKKSTSSSPEQAEFDFSIPDEDLSNNNEMKVFKAAFHVVRTTLRSLANTKNTKNEDEDEVLPDVREIVSDRRLSERFFRNEVPNEVVQALQVSAEGRKGKEASDLQALVRLFMICRYFLERLAVTEVIVSREEYAFDMFEALNTTGAPLTAIETFRPRVINREGLEHYQDSESAQCMKRVEQYLESPGNENREQASHRLLIPFALFQTGEKLSKHLREQRNWLRRQYDGLEDINAQRDFVRGMSYVAQFLEECWPEERKGEADLGLLSNLAATTDKDTALLCLEVLKSARHSITVSILARFYSQILTAKPQERPKRQQDFVGALKAVVAFFALWRSSRVGTENIDKVYRDLMAIGLDDGEVKIMPANRQKGNMISLDDLLAFLRRRLRDKYIDTQSGWLDKAANIAVYTQSNELTRLLLLAAFEDAVPDLNKPGFTKDGRSGVFPSLTLERWRDNSSEIEHIAPQTRQSEWPTEIYEKAKVSVLGNLTLLPRSENASVSNSSWRVKHFYFKVLSASEADVEPLFEEARSRGIDLPMPSKELLSRGRHYPHLKALSELPDDSEWDMQFIQERTIHLLERAWKRLAPWLGL